MGEAFGRDLYMLHATKVEVTWDSNLRSLTFWVSMLTITQIHHFWLPMNVCQIPTDVTIRQALLGGTLSYEK